MEEPVFDPRVPTRPPLPWDKGSAPAVLREVTDRIPALLGIDEG